MKPNAMWRTEGARDVGSARAASCYRTLGVVASASLLWAGTAIATPTPQQSVNDCQNAVKGAAAKFIQGKIAAVSTCLQAISGDLIKKNLLSISTATAKACASQFRKIHDTRVGKFVSLEAKKVAAINKKCDPTTVLTLNINDITGNAGGLSPQSIETNNIEAWCQNFGGSGSITTLQQWIDCIDNAHECAGDLGISVQYPRALDWLGKVKLLIGGLVAPVTDPTKYSDAVTAITQVISTIDGPDSNGVPSMQCGQAPPAVCSTECCYQEFSLGTQVSCFQYTGTAAEVGVFTANCTGKSSTPPGAWTMSAAAGVCGNPLDFPAHVACPAANTVVIPKDSSCP